MTRFIALLRGINISGKNKVPMKELKLLFENNNYKDVITYINSGNIIFTSDKNKEDINKEIGVLLKDKYEFDIPFIVITNEELKDILDNNPPWWGLDNKEIYNNLILIMEPLTYNDVYKEIGDAKDGIEQIFNYKNAIYWSFLLKCYSKTNWIKTASSTINDKVTIRTANTMKKLLELSKEV